MAAPVLPVCAASAPRSRFQTLQRVGISIGSSRRTAAAHQSAGNSRRGRCFFRSSRSARTSRIIALPPSMAACIPFMPRIPPPARAAARPLPSRADDPTGSTQTQLRRTAEHLVQQRIGLLLLRLCLGDGSMADEIRLPPLDRALVDALLEDGIGRVLVPADGLRQPQRNFLRRQVILPPEHLHDLPFRIKQLHGLPPACCWFQTITFVQICQERLTFPDDCDSLISDDCNSLSQKGGFGSSNHTQTTAGRCGRIAPFFSVWRL